MGCSLPQCSWWAGFRFFFLKKKKTSTIASLTWVNGDDHHIIKLALDCWVMCFHLRQEGNLPALALTVVVKFTRINEHSLPVELYKAATSKSSTIVL